MVENTTCEVTGIMMKTRWALPCLTMMVLSVAACTAQVPATETHAPTETTHDTHAATHPAQPAADAHASHEAHLVDAALPPPPAQPWATDAPLRKGMGDIAGALAQARAAARDGFSDEEAATFEAAVDSAFKYMLAHCKLEPQADVVLHAFLARLLGIARELKAAPAQHAEVFARMDEALAAYPEYFDHPGWATSHGSH